MICQKLATSERVVCYFRKFAFQRVEQPMHVSSKAPCRVDLAGGTLDIWPLYLFHERPVTVNFAVDRYTYCDVHTREDSAIILRSSDLKNEERFGSFGELYAARKYKLPLLALLVRFFAPDRGIEWNRARRRPAGAGISGSSALMISVASALNKVTGRDYALEKLREIVQNIEAQVIRVPTGSQDYYPAMYGGVSGAGVIARRNSQNRLPVAAELNSRFVLAYTGAPATPGSITGK